MSNQDTKESVQTLLNRSHNGSFELQERLVYGYDAVTGQPYALAVNSDGELVVTVEVESLEGIGVFDDFEQATGGMTAASSDITLTQEVESFDIQNTGDNIVYVNFDAAAAVTDIAIDPGMTMSRSLKVTAIHGICDAGLTSTLRVVGYF